MKIRVKNLGVLKQAEFSLGDFTIICGENNTGKTYTTYALYGFLDSWRRRFDDASHIPKNTFNELKENGVTRINLVEYAQKAQEILNQICRHYSFDLHRVFAAPEEKFRNTQFHVLLGNGVLTNSIKPMSFERNIGIGALSRQMLSLSKDEESEELEVSLLVDMQEMIRPPGLLKRFIAGAINEIIFSPIFPTPFIVSAERTGVAIFREELNFARNRLLKEISQVDEQLDPRELLRRSYEGYPSPVEANAEFTRRLGVIEKEKSFLAKKHPEVLERFADIIGGEYRMTRNSKLYFVPKGKRIRLSIHESASAVRSMLDIGFYLRHVAKQGDLLMVDEPELSLHPENQRRIARLFARLVNLGIKVFITTHSDYIVKELNTLIMLNQNKPHLKKIAKQGGYDNSELLRFEKIKMYIAEKAPLKPDGYKQIRLYPTLTKAQIDPELGIEARSFDKTINKMNDIQDAIVWGDDE